MVDQALPTREPRRLSRLLAWLAGELALTAIVVLALVPLGWRLGLWHFRVSLLSLMVVAASVGAVAALTAIAALTGWSGLRRGTRLVGVAALLVGGLVAWVPWHYRLAVDGVPPIHDISTDTEDPPGFTAVLPARAAENGGALAYGPDIAKQQRAAYPDIAPTQTGLPPAQAFARALKAAEAMPGWHVVASDPAAGRIEASQSSFWMGFTDDVSIRVQPQAAGSRIDVRSVSRQGRSDLGVNAERVRTYLDRLRRELG